MDALDSVTKIEERLCVKATMAGIPLGGTFELSPACNMSCKMCYARLGMEEIAAQGGLKTGEEWLKIAAEMQKEGTIFLLLTGGEPLLYPDFKQVYEGVRRMGMIVTINTNGTLITEEWAKYFAQDKPRRINITLYGVNKKGYKNLCGYEKGFDTTINGIQLLKEKNLDVKLNVSLTPDNVKDLDEFYKIAEQLEVPIEIDSYMFPFCREKEEYEQENRLMPEKCAEVYLKILKKERPEGYKKYFQLCQMYIEGKKFPNHNEIVCRAGKSSFWINWKGDMSPCFALESKATNVFEIGFKNAWRKNQEYVNSIKLSTKCSNCEKQKLCISCAGRTFSETGSVMGTPEYICKYMQKIFDLIE